MTGTNADPLSILLARLEGVKQSGARYLARCPAHQDRSPSLSLSQGDDGRVLIHCHAGCSASDVLAAVGMGFRDLFPGSLSNEQRALYRRAALERERRFERLIVEAAENTSTAGEHLPDEDIRRLAEAHDRLKRLDRELADFEEQPVREAIRQVGIENVMSSKLEKVSHSVNPWMPRRHVTLFGGHGGIGKSSLALAICAHVACGRPFAGMQVEQSKALFVSLEDEPMIVKLRLRHIIEAYNLPPEQVLTNMRVVDGTQGSAALMTEGEGYGALPVFTAAFAEVVDHAEGMGLIVIDNASDAFDANENSRREVRSFIRGLAALARKQQAAVVLLAHIDKAGAKAGAQGNSYSGSTAWHNSTRSRLALLEQDGQIVLKHEKANLGPKADPVTFEFNEHGVLMPATAVMPVEGTDLQAVFDAKELYGVLRIAIKAGIDVPTATRGPSTTWHALEPMPELPSHFRSTQGKRRFNAAVMRLFREGRIVRESYRKAARNTGERWKLAAKTDAASHAGAISQLEKVRVINSPIPPSETNALGKRCVSSSTLGLSETSATDETDAAGRAPASSVSRVSSAVDAINATEAAGITSSTSSETEETGATDAVVRMPPPSVDQTDARAF